MDTNFQENHLGSIDIRKQAFDFAPNSIMVIDPTEMKFVDANQTALASLGYTKEEFVGLPIEDINASFTNETMAAAFESIIKSKDQGATIPTKHRKKDKSIFDVEVYLRCFKEGEKVYILASSTETSILRQAQNELNFHSALFNKISDAIISTDEHFVITSWNKYAEEMFGWTAKEAIGSPTRDLTAAIYPNQTSEEVTQFVRDNGHWKGEIFAHRKNGSVIPVMLSIGVVQDSVNNVTGYVSVVRDISERHKLETELRSLNQSLEKRAVEKAQELTNVFERITDGFVAYDKDFRYIYINKQASEIIGIPSDELAGVVLWEVFPHLIGTDMYYSFLSAMKEQQVKRLTHFNAPTNRWFEVTLHPSPQGLSTYFHDITDNKNFEEKLKESEEQYRTIVDTAHEGILQIDENNLVVFANKQLCSFIGYTVEEVVGKNALAFLGEPNQEQVLLRLENRKLGLAEQYEMSLLSKTGKQVHTLINSRPLFKNDTYAGSISTIMDITEKKLAEEKIIANEKRLNALFEHSSDGICLFSPDGTIIEINPAVENILGYKREELINSKKEIVVPEDVPLVLATLAKVVKDKNIIETIEYRIVKKDGSKKWLRATYQNMISNPDIAAIVINFVDIDESRRIQEALKEGEKRYRKAQAQGKLGHWHRDLATGVVTWSEEVYRIFEHDTSKPVLNYEGFLSFVHPNDKEFVTNEHKLALSGQKEFNLFYRVVTKDGELKYLHEVADINKDDQEQPLFLSGMVQDVTQQKLVEEQLKESQQQLSIILNNIVDSVSLFKVEGSNKFRYLAVNDTYTKTTKIEREQAIGKLLGELMPSRHFEQLYTVLNRAISTCEIQQFESTYDWYEGKKAFLINIVPIKNEAGCADKLLVIAKDTTEQKLAEEKLIKSEEKNRVLFDHTPVPIWILDRTLKFLQVNETAVSEYGYSKEEFLNMSLFDIKPIEDHPFLRGVIENWDGTHQYSGITTHITKSGEIIYSRVHSTSLNLDQQDVILVATKNITLEVLAQKEIIENEQQLSLIFDSTKDAMWLLKVEDSDTYRIETYNKAYESLLGISKDEWVGKLIHEVLTPELSERSINKNRQVVQSGKLGGDFLSLPSVNGDFTAEVTITPIKDYSGKVVRLLGTAVDVTHQQKARKELVKLNVELRELASHLQNVREEERTHIAREIHDELGQQLTGLKMDLAWLKKKIKVEEEAVTNKLNSALQLIDVTINTVRKIASELRPSIIDDLGIREALDWQCQEFTKRTGIKVSFTSAIGNIHLPKAVPTALFRIVQEALTNVARHSKASEVKCTLEKLDNELLLSISDNGQGFSLNNQEQKTLGLLGMRERVAILKGKYDIKSEPGQGTIITVNIPLTS